MIRRIRRRPQRGQALAEMALLLPILVGFFALTLQGGLVISDQVNLQHYAYEGAQWAVNNRTSASTTAIATHIQTQMCGTTSGTLNPINTSTAVSRYCRDNTLSIAVSTANATASRAGWSVPMSLVPLSAEAASSCKQWDLTVPASSSASPISIAQGSSTNITLGMTAPSGSGSTPLANLSVSGLPGFLSNGTPQFNPQTITNTGTTTNSIINIAPSINTAVSPAGSPYQLKFDGIDQCGGTPTVGYKSVWIAVTNGGGPGTLALPLDLHLDGVFPLCIPTGSASTLTLHGVNFSSGATVVIGAGASALTGTVTGTTSTTMTVTIPAPPTAGVYDATVTLGDGTSYTLANAVTVAASCSAVTPAPGTSSSSATACSAGSAGQATEYTVTITWTEKLIIPWITSNVGLTAKQRAFCQ